MSLKVSGEMYVSIEYVKSGQVVRTKIGNKKVGERLIDMTDKAEANVEIGVTKNLGNYESLRVSVGVKLPCTTDEVTTTLERAKALAETHLHKFVHEAMDDSVKF